MRPVRRTTSVLASLLSLALSGTAAAQQAALHDCAPLNTVDLLVGKRSFPDADEREKELTPISIEVAVVDTGGEPVCCSMHALIYVSLDDYPGEQFCYRLSEAGREGRSAWSSGFVHVPLAGVLYQGGNKRSYLYIPVRRYGVEPPMYRFQRVVIDHADGKARMLP